MIATDTHHQVTDAIESAVVGKSMQDPSLLDSISFLSADDFRDERLAMIYATIRHRHQRGEGCTVLDIGESMARSGALAEKIGPDGIQFLIRLTNAPLIADVVGHAQQLHQEANRRRLATKLELLRGAVDDPTFSADAIQRQLVDAAAGLQPEPDVSILDCCDLIEQYPDLRDPVVEGFLRRGETANIIAKSKVGKSWFGYGLGFSVALGRDWLGRFPTRRGRVLLLDNELHRETLSHRIQAVLSAMGLRRQDARGKFDTIALRGQCRDIHAVGPILRRIPRDKYSLIIVDAFYRLLPGGESENDNNAMTAVYNAVDDYGEQTGAAFALIHHATKGDQSGKDVTDVGSGAGAISRAADTHLILRPHEDEDAVVLAAKTRSWAEPSPVGLRWMFPSWVIDDNLDPSLLKGRRPAGEERKAEGDKADCDKIILALKEQASTERRLRSRTGFGRSKQQRLLDLLTSQGKVQVRTVEYKGKECEEYFAI